MGSYNVLIIGVGGQGVIFASSVLGRAALNSGLNVVIGETKGLARRGGTVEAHVKIGYSENLSPLIPPGYVDLLLSFEFMEGLRYLNRVRRGGIAVISTESIKPINSYIYRGEKYPKVDSSIDILSEYAGINNVKIILFDPKPIVSKLKLPQVANMAMLGFAYGVSGVNVGKVEFIKAIRDVARGRYVKENIEAFNEGLRCSENVKAKISKPGLVVFP